MGHTGCLASGPVKIGMEVPLRKSGVQLVLKIWLLHMSSLLTKELIKDRSEDEASLLES